MDPGRTAANHAAEASAAHLRSSDEAAPGSAGLTMPDYGRELQFGAFVPPVAAQAGEVLELSRLADVVGLDLLTFQDHPYQPSFLDTWTLLAVVAAQTASVRVAPNVANLPLRPPVVLARSVATLDVLSGGRVELGLGAGAFWDAIAAFGVPRLSPRASVDALDEAIDVIRAVWTGGDGELHVEGEHHRISGGRAGLAPAHDVEIWLGAYKPRMLAITGRKADGWLPSMAYATPGELPAMQARIDEAAVAAGRSPAEIRRLYNVNDGSRLQGSPAEWAEQLAELALRDGIDTFILAVSAAGDLRRFAEEVAPATRELVDGERARSERSSEVAAPPEAPLAMPLAVQPTVDDGTRLTAESVWDEDTRPTAQPPDGEYSYTRDQQAAGRHLVDVHDGLRAELERIRDLLEQVGQGAADPSAVRSLLNRMTIRQNNWAVGVHCQAYCRILTGHHTLEDRGIFPHLRRRDPELDPVLHRLEKEHETIAELLDRVDETLVALVASENGALERVRASMDVLTDALLSHFAYEERELVEPLARFGYA
jgi:alkanesulfonate monooxygenase SsuD/methylene tetrahydromethanopterin reductase-like flavin-dependent oxidoreductase (luciferase family)